MKFFNKFNSLYIDQQYFKDLFSFVVCENYLYDGKKSL